jgi:hypothetical protein
MWKKKAQKKIKTTDHVNCALGDSFIPSMKSQNESFWMVQWQVLGHSSPLFEYCFNGVRENAPCRTAE